MQACSLLHCIWNKFWICLKELHAAQNSLHLLGMPLHFVFFIMKWNYTRKCSRCALHYADVCSFFFLTVAAGREEMLTQLLLGWTALLSGLQLAAASVTTSEYKQIKVDLNIQIGVCRFLPSHNRVTKITIHHPHPCAACVLRGFDVCSASTKGSSDFLKEGYMRYPQQTGVSLESPAWK